MRAWAGWLSGASCDIMFWILNRGDTEVRGSDAIGENVADGSGTFLLALRRAVKLGQGTFRNPSPPGTFLNVDCWRSPQGVLHCSGTLGHSNAPGKGPPGKQALSAGRLSQCHQDAQRRIARGSAPGRTKSASPLVPFSLCTAMPTVRELAVTSLAWQNHLYTNKSAAYQQEPDHQQAPLKKHRIFIWSLQLSSIHSRHCPLHHKESRPWRSRLE